MTKINHRVFKRRLKNGLHVVLLPRPQLRQAYAGIYFAAGSRSESPKDNGLMHALEHMLFRGTERYATSFELNRVVESMGGYLDGATYRDHVAFSLGFHPSQVKEALQVLAEMVQRPRYRSLAVEKEVLKEEVLESLNRRGRMIDIDTLSHRMMFGGAGLGQPIEGTLANVDAFMRADLERFRSQYMVGNNGVLVVAGPFEEAALWRRAQRLWGDLPAGERAVVEPWGGGQTKPRLQWVREPGSQVDMRFAFPAVSYKHADHVPLVMLARVLADGLASRMYRELVDKQGLAYSIDAGLTTYEDCGVFDFEWSVAPRKAVESMAAVREFIARAARYRYSAEELQRVVQKHAYQTSFMEDSAADLSAWHGTAVLFEYSDSLADFQRKLAAVTAQQLRDMAKRYFSPKQLCFTVVGPLPGTNGWSALQKGVTRWAAA